MIALRPLWTKYYFSGRRNRETNRIRAGYVAGRQAATGTARDMRGDKKKWMTPMAGAYDDRDGLIWMDGALVPWRDAKVHVLTHALHYASAVFEGERAYGGVIFKGHEHSKRLLASAAALDIPSRWTAEEIDLSTDPRHWAELSHHG